MSIRRPSIITVSSKLAPDFPSTLIISKLTSFLSKSATYKTAFTAIVANFLLHLLTILDPKEIIAAYFSISLLSFLISRVSEISSRVYTAISQAFSKPSAILRGCSPLSISIEAYSNKAPANTTTEVVPSPISSS